MENKTSVFDKITENSAYVKFMADNNNTVRVKFLNGEPVESVNQYENPQYDFQVSEEGQIKTFSVTSIRLMLKLKANRPLDGKEFCIQRVGTGMQTQYNVSLIQGV